jgi:hypothetical protein
MQDGPPATAVAEAVAAEQASVAADSMVVVLPVAGSTVLVVLMVALSAAVAFVVAILVDATGVGTGTIAGSLIASSSAATVIRGGGIIRTDITVTTITRTLTMDTADTPTIDTAGTVTTVRGVTDTAIAADQDISEAGPDAAIAE